MSIFNSSVPGDLHMHSKMSDGKLSVAELVDLINIRNLSIVSITDHETVQAYYTDDIKRLNAILIPGVELRFNFNDMIAELLSYKFDLERMNAFLTSGIYPTRENAERFLLNSLVEIANKKKLKLKDGIIENYDPTAVNKVVKYFLDNIDISDERTAQIMQDECPAGCSFFRTCAMNSKSSWYVNTAHLYPDFNTVVAAIRDCGGLVFVPHAFAYGEFSKEFIQFVVSSKKIQGFEVEHSIFSEDQSKFLYDLVGKENLLFSKGSDFHAYSQGRMVGSIKDYSISITLEMQDWILGTKKIK